MTEKRFNIVSSEIVEGGKFVQDNNKKYSFPTTKDSASLIMYEKALNELSDENEQLKNEVYDWKASAEDYLKLGQSLKKENEQLKKEGANVERLIDDLGSEELRRQYEEIINGDVE